MTLVNNGSHFDFIVQNNGKKRVLFVLLQFGSTHYQSKAFELQPGAVILRIEGSKSTFAFSYTQDHKANVNVESVDTKFLSS